MQDLCGVFGKREGEKLEEGGGEVRKRKGKGGKERMEEGATPLNKIQKHKYFQFTPNSIRPKIT